MPIFGHDSCVRPTAAARLQHPNVVQVYEVGEAISGPFFSMEWITGGSLDEKIAGASYTADDAANLVKTLAETMEYAHKKGIIHRDLKPANVLLTETEQVKITDFGLAKIMETAGCAEPGADGTALTQTGAIVGTPCYMAPEQVDGRTSQIGVATDIYALGAILYELLTGRPPFRADTPLETFQLIRTSEPIPPRRWCPPISRDLETICLKCLEKDPRHRYHSAAGLAEDLARLLGGEPILARPTGPLGRTWRWCRRKPLIVALTAALILSLLGGFAGVTWQWIRAERQTLVAQGNADRAERQRDEADVERERALKEKHRAEENFEAARNVVERFTRLGEGLTSSAGTEATGRRVLEESLNFYETLLELESTDPAARFQSAQAHYRVSQIHHDLGQWQEAEYTNGHAISLLTALVAEFPQRPDYRFYLAHAFFQRANVYRRAGRGDQAAVAFGHAIRLSEELVNDFPNTHRLKSFLAMTLINRLTVLPDVDPNEWATVLHRAVAMLDQVMAADPMDESARSDLAIAKESLATTQWRVGHLEAAEQLLNGAISLRHSLLEEVGRICRRALQESGRSYATPRHNTG